MKNYTVTKDKLAAMFREYWNDFLTLEGWASYHGINKRLAVRLIHAGRRAHNLKAEQLARAA